MMNMIVGLGASMLAPKLMSSVKNQKVNVLHATPGRVRLQCDRWKNEATANNLKQVFHTIPLVKEVEASPITGTLLLKFTNQTLTAEQFDGIVQSAVQTSIATYPELQGDLMNILQHVVQTVDTSIKRQSGGKVDIDSLLSVILILSGITKSSTNPAFSASLLYWAYTLITKK